MTRATVPRSPSKRNRPISQVEPNGKARRSDATRLTEVPRAVVILALLQFGEDTESSIGDNTFEQVHEALEPLDPAQARGVLGGAKSAQPRVRFTADLRSSSLNAALPPFRTVDT